MFFYEIIECYSMNTSSIVVYSDKQYSIDEFNDICESIKYSYTGDVQYLQQYIKNSLIKNYNFKEMITTATFSYDFD